MTTEKAPTKAELAERLAEVKEALDGNDASTIRTKAEDLMQASHKLAEAIYQNAQAQQQSTAATGGNGTDGAASSDDEVVEEADYEVIDEEAKTS